MVLFKMFLENLNVASVPKPRHTKSLKPTIVESDSSEDESKIYTPPKKSTVVIRSTATKHNDTQQL